MTVILSVERGAEVQRRAKKKLKLVIRADGMHSVRRREKIYDNLVPSAVDFDKNSVKLRV